jgi:ribosome-associated protein
VTSLEKIKVIETPKSLADDNGREQADVALAAALDKQALQPELLDVRGMCSYTNFILVVSGRSDRQVGAIAESVTTALREHLVRPLGVEGRDTGQWVLLDFGDLIVHVFHHSVRERYDIESLWIDAKRVAIDVPAEARPAVEDSYMS